MSEKAVEYFDREMSMLKKNHMETLHVKIQYKKEVKMFLRKHSSPQGNLRVVRGVGEEG